MRVSFVEHAGTFTVPGKGECPERFAPHAFDSLAGQTVPWTYEGGRIGEATVVGVVVSDDGLRAEWTVDVEADADTDGGSLMRGLWGR